MPHKITIIEGRGIRAAPNSQIAAGKMKFKLLDSNNNPIPNSKIKFHVMYGGGYFIDQSIFLPEQQQMIETRTDSSGIVTSPEFKMGPDEGPNAILVQSFHASKEIILFGTYLYTQLILDPPLGPSDFQQISFSELDVSIKAVDKLGTPDEQPVQYLPLEAEVISGSATIETGFDRSHGNYLLKRTSAYARKGTIDLKIRFGRRTEQTKIRITPYWNRNIANFDLTFDVRSPGLGNPTPNGHLNEDAVGSVGTPIRIESNDGPGGTIISTSNPNVSPDYDLLISANEENIQPGNETVSLHPADTNSYVNDLTIFPLLKREKQSYEIKTRLPDFPDSGSVINRGDSTLDLQDGIPSKSTGAGLVYILIQNGGNLDRPHQIKVDVVERPIQYLGPNAITVNPTRIAITKFRPPSNYELVETKIKFKVRTSPFNSSVDDPTNPNLTPGEISKSRLGPWQDEFEEIIPGGQATIFRNVFFKSNSKNYDHHVEVTAKVTMKRIHPDGSVTFERDVDSRIKIRFAILRPRVLLTKKVGNNYEPVREPGIIPFTIRNRNGSQITNLPQNSKFYVELKCHDIGTTVAVPCELRTKDTKTITLKKLNKLTNIRYTVLILAMCTMIYIPEMFPLYEVLIMQK